ncbi:MAG TPA: protease inhibitor I42 family protein [Verrucomicrobiae bacterium]|jgi:predicted secreted protein|nr:protease inhibitor I42 family protein [Verrucomicrobiae bacterium]
MTRWRSRPGQARFVRAGAAVLLLSAGCATAPAAVSDRDLTVSEGTTFTVALDRRAGAGYGWMVDGADAQTVTLVSRSVERDPAMAGASEREVFVFLARRSGTATLRFAYTRPWEAATLPPAEARAYRVQVIRC